MSKRLIVIFVLFAGLVISSAAAVNRHFAVVDLEQRYADLQKQPKDTPQVQESKLTITMGHREYDKLTLARQNRNFLNIKTLSNGGYWVGQIGVDQQGHAIFKDPIWSIRAGIILLRTYENKHKIDTITKLVDRFCTGNKKDYVRCLVKATKIGKDQKISLTQNLHLLIPAMIVFETGENLGVEYVEIIKATME